MNEKILMGGEDTLLVWNSENRSAIGISDRIVKKEEILSSPEQFKYTKFLFSTWGMPTFSKEEIHRYLPSLQAVFYAAGTVRSFALPFLESGVAIFSAQAANAVPVAEYTVAQILLANKGFFGACRRLHHGEQWRETRAYSQSFPGNYGATVGIIGCGMIGRMVAEHLRSYHLRVVIYDAFLTDAQIRELGAERVSLETLFQEANVVSNHLANVPATVGMFERKHFASMKNNAVFLNTGRGATVKQEELIDVLRERTDLTAILDVTDPEPPEKDSPLCTLPNVFLTPHISGSQNLECARMGAYMAEEYHNFVKGSHTKYQITKEMLDTMA